MMISSLRPGAAAFAVSLTTAFLTVEPAEATVLADGFSTVFAAALCPAGPLETCQRPGTSASFDDSLANGFLALADATASFFGPVASVQGETQNGDGKHG